MLLLLHQLNWVKRHFNSKFHPRFPNPHKTKNTDTAAHFTHGTVGFRGSEHIATVRKRSSKAVYVPEGRVRHLKYYVYGDGNVSRMQQEKTQSYFLRYLFTVVSSHTAFEWR